MKQTVTRAAALVAAALALSACGSSPEPAAPSEFAVVSADFVDGGPLADAHAASAFGGQCSGDNVNPQLSWSGAPEGTVAYAITVRDESANDWTHWVRVNIPTSVTDVATGGSESLPGASGMNDAGSGAYFGPCPPSGTHRYVFTVYALDTELDWDVLMGAIVFQNLSAGHVLATATITGVYPPEG